MATTNMAQRCGTVFETNKELHGSSHCFPSWAVWQSMLGALSPKLNSNPKPYTVNPDRTLQNRSAKTSRSATTLLVQGTGNSLNLNQKVALQKRHAARFLSYCRCTGAVQWFAPIIIANVDVLVHSPFHADIMSFHPMLR